VVVCLFVRHQFYLNASESYLAGRLRVSDRQLVAQITSLIVHAETRDRLKTTGQQVCIETDPCSAVNSATTVGVLLLMIITHTHRHTTVLRPCFQDRPSEPVPEENFWTLWCKGRLTEADTPTIRLGATPSGLTSAHLHHPPIFYRPDVLPAAQPTASKH